MLLVATMLTACSSSATTTAPTSTAPKSVPALGAQPAGAAGSAGGLPWLHVVHPTTGLAYIADSADREVQLRGVNSEGLEDEARRTDPTMDRDGVYPIDPVAYRGRCPANSNAIAAPLCEVDAGKGRYQQPTTDLGHNDFAQMRADGFNVVRLAVSWSQLEPTPGRYNPTYIDRIAQVVDWAKEQGVYVLVDMHQDEWSRFIQPGSEPCPAGTEPAGGFDGAPKWAVVTSPKPSCGRLGQANDAPAVEASFDAFWHDATLPGVPQGAAPGPGLADHYIGAMAAIARRFKDESTVVGYELMNEPQGGSANPIKVSDDLMYPFYRRAIEALTGERDGHEDCPASNPSNVSATGGFGPACAYPDLGVDDSRHLILFEPQAVRNLVDFSPQHSKAFSAYPNLVFAPHVYTHIFTVDTSFIGFHRDESPYPTADFGYATAAAEAEAMHAAVMATEFGDSIHDDPTILAGSLRAQEAWGIGGMLWTWKANCGLKTSDHCDDPWAFYESAPSGPGPQPQNGAPQPNRLKYMVRTYPVATAGHLDRHAFDPITGAFFLDATSTKAVTKGDTGHETVIWVPASRAPKDPGTALAITVQHAVVDRTTVNPDGSRTVYVAPNRAGSYRVEIGRAAAVKTLIRSVTAQGPLTPITFAQAQAELQRFLTTTINGTDKTRAANATAVAALTEAVLSGRSAIP